MVVAFRLFLQTWKSWYNLAHLEVICQQHWKLVRNLASKMMTISYSQQLLAKAPRDVFPSVSIGLATTVVLTTTSSKYSTPTSGSLLLASFCCNDSGFLSHLRRYFVFWNTLFFSSLFPSRTQSFLATLLSQSFYNQSLLSFLSTQLLCSL